MLHSATAQIEAMIKEGPAERRWLSTGEAAAAACVGSQQTIRNWCKRYDGLGNRIRGVWHIDAIMLDKVLSDRRT